MSALTRREALAAGLAATAALLLGFRLGRAGAQTAAGAPPIRGRDDWAAGLAPTGPLEVERPEDVRFLLVHHTVSANDYGPAAVPELLRSFYRLHTAKGWPDIAYNFLVDRFGGVWEGRQGSVDAPVKGDATGGSQGFAQLCCFVGDHQRAAPSPEAQESMVALLAWLADRYQIDPRPGARASFISRGSNRWPAGAAVTTATIAGHRDMSRTACPGDAAYQLVNGPFPERAAARLGLAGGPVPAPPPAEAPPTTTSSVAPAAPSTAAPLATTTTATSTSTSTSTSTQPVPATAPPGRQALSAAPPSDDPGGGREALIGGGAAGLFGSAALVAWLRRRRPA